MTPIHAEQMQSRDQRPKEHDPSRPSSAAPAPHGWSASRADEQKSEKDSMAVHFVQHEFLAPHGGDPAIWRLERAASILVNRNNS